MTGTSVPGPHPLDAFLALILHQTSLDPEAMRAAMAGVRRYQEARRAPPPAAGRTIFQQGGTRLRHLAGPDGGPPLVLLPSIINGPEILDFDAERSLAHYLGGRGFRVLLIDWGGMDGGDRRLSLAGLVSARILPLLRRVGRPVVLAGYCLGGTLALATAAIGGPAVVARLALIAAPWHFAGYGVASRDVARAAWQSLAPVALALGGLPLPLLNPLFWSLDPEGVVAKFVRLGRLPEADPLIAEFVRLEDWAGNGPPIGPAAARDLFNLGFARDAIGRGRWRVSGTGVRPEALTIPILDVGAARDRLVPAAARLNIAGIQRLTVEAGHVGLVVGRGRHALWDPLSNFAESA